jgi:8-oxo-dGTP diphosphatase
VSVRVAVVLVKDGRVLLARHEKGGESYWVLPGGAVEPGETLAEALRRELREEAGLAIEPGDILFLNDGYRPEAETVAVYFSAALRGQAEAPKVTPGKVLREVRWVPAEELSHLDLRPNIRSELLEYLRTGRIRSRYLGRR